MEQTKQERINTLIELLAYKYQIIVTINDLIDWDITAETSDKELEQYANDFASEEHTNKCEVKNAWRYEN